MSQEKTVTVERSFKSAPAQVFKAIGEGRLFQNCSANMKTSKIDFRVGGKYWNDFDGYGMVSMGEFLEIIPDQKIVFTWSGSATDDQSTRVAIELSPKGTGTSLKLTHSGFDSDEMANDHKEGWTGGLSDLCAEMEENKISIGRPFSVSVSKLYEACSSPARFFGIVSEVEKGEVEFRVGGQYRFPCEDGREIKGKFLEILPNQKIAFSWLSAPCGAQVDRDTKVTLEFTETEKGKSYLDLTHELLPTQETVRLHRSGWENLILELRKNVNK